MGAGPGLSNSLMPASYRREAAASLASAGWHTAPRPQRGRRGYGSPSVQAPYGHTVLTSRELASLIWLGATAIVVAVMALRDRSLARSIGNVAATALRPPISTVI